MNTAIIITLIICGTIIVLALLNTIDRAIESKRKPRTIMDVLGMSNKEN